MASEAGKGDKRIPEAKPGSYAENWGTVFSKPKPPARETEHQGEDGPGMDEASKEGGEP
jgi:hypothetical protein